MEKECIVDTFHEDSSWQNAIRKVIQNKEKIVTEMDELAEEALKQLEEQNRLETQLNDLGVIMRNLQIT